MSEISTKDLIRQEIENLINETKKSVGEVKSFAVSEVWKILQLLTAVVIQLIENLGNNLSSPEKKELALELISSFYDKIFTVVDIPWVPALVEPIIHSHVKSFLMLLVSSGIDAMVATFRQVGVFKPKEPISVQSNVSTERKVVVDFLNNLKQIVRTE
jgi:ABC-type iron transport system FetAB permease component